ncbi:unnamed protein product [Phytophthora lilii]|uniref:Unnamed protein product n=1 Tax=Phytophthora lilii TaxID=2077276 RepID=A0A9W6X8B0_9STRA|nr:unnamed protein product [Phytophthora lilii]
MSASRTYLCNKVWPHYPGNTMTCFQIWHYQWDNGNKRPHPRCGRDIQNRASGGSAGGRAAGKRKRQARGTDDEVSEEDEEEDAAERPPSSNAGSDDEISTGQECETD